MDSVVHIKNLKKIFGDFTAVNDISLSVKKGEIFGFLGPNGAGKSTTIKMLCGILEPSSGSGFVHGHDIITEQNKIKSSIGYMSQKFSLYEDLTVTENLEFFGSLYNIPPEQLKKDIPVSIEMAGIAGRKDELVKNLPGGLKQRLALSSAILHRPPILFLDEPTSGVDPVMRRNFWDIIDQFSQEGRTIFVTTHYMDEAEHCDRIALIISGSIIALDSPEKLKQDMPYTVYSLIVDDFIHVFDMIATAPFINECAIFGSEIHILCEKEIPVEKKIKDILADHRITNFTLSSVPPTLEDVFVTHARRYTV